MQFLRPTSSPARTALAYITLGSLIMVWTGVYWFYRVNHADDTNQVPYYWIFGFMATGLTLFIIGLATGQIGKAARPAEAAPPAVVTAPAPVPVQTVPVNQAPTNPPPAGQAAPVAVMPANVAAGQPAGTANAAGLGS